MRSIVILMRLASHGYFQRVFIGLLLVASAMPAVAQRTKRVTLTNVDSGWSRNSINAVVFRKNSLVTFRDTQFISFYDPNGTVVVGKRALGANQWTLRKTNYTGHVRDAHNSISLMVDGEGYLHLAWNQHNNVLNYCVSKQPFSLELSDKITMTGQLEKSVSYPEFFKMPGGDLLFFYRDGASGKGNLVINKYSIASRQWQQLHSNLIDGEGQRNAYWQSCIGPDGTVHLSWVWRESPDVASNHDMCYARSRDGGISWEKSTGEKYPLPITAASAEYIRMIPQRSELINQVSMTTDDQGHPVIAGYWRDGQAGIPQYHILYHSKGSWRSKDLAFRRSSFSLTGAGTKKIPISRPQVIAWNKKGKISAAVVFRDEERGNLVSMAANKSITQKNKWKLIDLTKKPVGSWEPSYDTELWKEKKQLHLFVQRVEQADAEGIADLPPQMIRVLQWQP